MENGERKKEERGWSRTEETGRREKGREKGEVRNYLREQP